MRPQLPGHRVHGTISRRRLFEMRLEEGALVVPPPPEGVLIEL